jgi:hypothetical protein
MSGKPWNAERKAAFRAAMRKRWRSGAYARRRPATIDETERARRQARMAALNLRMSHDEALKAKCVRRQKRARRSPAYRAVQSAVMRELMSSPEMRRTARYHAIRINKNARVRKRQWATRRRKRAAAVAADPLLSKLRTVASMPPRTWWLVALPKPGHAASGEAGVAFLVASVRPAPACARRRSGVPP